MRKRIAMISEHASPLAALGGVDSGGQNVYVAYLARQLAHRGHAVDVFTRRESADTPTIVDWGPRVRIVHVDAGPPRRVPKEQLLPFMSPFAEWMLDFVDRGSRTYDIVHAHFWTSALAAQRLKIEIGLPFVVTFHALGRVRRLYQGADDGFPAERGALEAQIVESADAVIAECPQDAFDLRVLYGADERRLRQIPCGVDIRRFHPVAPARARGKLGLPIEGPVLLQLGRLVPRKGIDDVIRSLPILRRAYDIDAQLVIVGGDTDEPDEAATPYLRTLRAVADGSGVADRVIFTGGKSPSVLRYYYSAADVFVTTPWYEPFGITPLEAMACGTPVIGSAVGGIKHTVVHGETGLLVPPHNPRVIAASAAALLTDSALRARMSRRAMARVRSWFRWRHVARAVDVLYDDVLGATRHRTHPRRARVTLP